MKCLTPILTLALGLWAHAQTPFPWPNGAAAAVSVTADDGWSSELTQADILTSHGFRGTFYLSGSIVKANETYAWYQRHANGHELGNHTYSHGYPTGTWITVKNDINKQHYWMQSYVTGSLHRTFSYPFGVSWVGPVPAPDVITLGVGRAEYHAWLSFAFPCAVTTNPSLNDPMTVQRNRFMLGRYFFPKAPDTLARAKATIDAAVASGQWLIMGFHQFDFDVNNGNAIDRATYEAIIDYLAQQNVWVAPVVDVYEYVAANTPPDDWSSVH